MNDYYDEYGYHSDSGIPESIQSSNNMKYAGYIPESSNNIVNKPETLKINKIIDDKPIITVFDKLNYSSNNLIIGLLFILVVIIIMLQISIISIISFIIR